MSSGFMFNVWSVPKIECSGARLIIRPGGGVEWMKTTRTPPKKEAEISRDRVTALEKAWRRADACLASVAPVSFRYRYR